MNAEALSLSIHVINHHYILYYECSRATVTTVSVVSETTVCETAPVHTKKHSTNGV